MGKSKKPLVSIIIPTYNRAHLLSETLDSIDRQTYTHWECIIVDDGSTDDTNTLIKKYTEKSSKFKYYQRPEVMIKGANACRNYGFDKSNGAFINWFDSDDIMSDRKLEVQVEHLINNDAPFTICQTLVFEDTIDRVIGLRNPNVYSNNFFGDFVTNKIKWLTQAPLIRRSFIEKYQLKYDETLSQSQERDFFIRMLDVVKDYHYDNTPLVFFRQHQNSISHGNVTEEKLRSNFRVNHMAIKTYGHKLTVSEKAIVKQGIKQVLKKSVRNGYHNLEQEITKKMNNYFTFYEKNKITFARFLIKKIGKGDFLFK